MIAFADNRRRLVTSIHLSSSSILGRINIRRLLSIHCFKSCTIPSIVIHNYLQLSKTPGSPHAAEDFFVTAGYLNVGCGRDVLRKRGLVWRKKTGKRKTSTSSLLKISFNQVFFLIFNGSLFFVFVLWYTSRASLQQVVVQCFQVWNLHSMSLLARPSTDWLTSGETMIRPALLFRPVSQLEVPSVLLPCFLYLSAVVFESFLFT